MITGFISVSYILDYRYYDQLLDTFLCSGNDHKLCEGFFNCYQILLCICSKLLECNAIHFVHLSVVSYFMISHKILSFMFSSQNFTMKSLRL